MDWKDVTAKPSARTLRQFAGLFMIFFMGIAGWRAWHHVTDRGTRTLALLALVVGVAGMAYPLAVRWIYTGWMIAAFPIGWTVSRVMLGVLFYLVFTPMAMVFRLMGRDVLRLKRRQAGSYWTPRPSPDNVKEYFRQS
jgi:TRAP-type C4-dicarboxylate transport system permease small subunit